MFRRSLDKITEDTIKLSEENTGLIIEKIKLKDKYYTQLNKTLSVEKKYLDLLQRVSPCERNKDEIERLNTLTDNVKGVNIYQWYFFLDGKIRHGDHIPRPLTRIIRNGITERSVNTWKLPGLKRIGLREPGFTRIFKFYNFTIMYRIHT